MTEESSSRPSGASAPSRERVTLNEVAEQAGVSTAAASLALRGRPGVAEPTRRRVQDVATELGYRARPIERSGLTVGLLMKARPHEIGEANAFYGPVMAGISEAAAAVGADVRLDWLPVDEHFNPIEVPRVVEAPDVDGVLVLGAFLSTESARMLDGRPLVLVDGYAEDARRFTTVVTDNRDGAQQATRRLIGLGHRDIVLAGTAPDTFPSILERRHGYVRAMHAAGLEPRFVDGHHDEPDTVVPDLLEARRRAPTITGVVAANDAVAVAIVAELGAAVPAELSVIGFDDIETAAKIRPRLDTVAVDKQSMGRVAVGMLLHRIRYPLDPAVTVVQPAELVIRESAAGPP